MIRKIIENRSKSSFGISVATGLALEALFEPTDERIDKDFTSDKIKSLKEYDSYFLNLNTIIRNFLGSLNKKLAIDYIYINIKKVVMFGYLVDELLNELHTIRFLFENQGIKPIFYNPDYKDILIFMDKLKLKKTKSLNKITQKRKEEIIVNNLKKIIIEEMKKDDFIINTKLRLNYKYGKILILTHKDFDLFNYKNVRKLDLLNSHTGLIYSYKSFNKRYKVDSKKIDVSSFPFYERMAYIIGTKNDIPVFDIKMKKYLLDILISKPISFNTSEETLINIIKRENKELYEYYKSLETFY